MPDPLIIQIRGDNAQWNRTVAASKQGARGLADEQVRQSKRSSDAHFVSLGKVQLAGVKLGDTLRAEAKKTADVQAREAQRAAAAQAREAQRAATAQAKEAQRAASIQVKEAERAATANFVALGKVQVAAVKHGDRLRSEAQKTANAQAKEADRAATANFVSLGKVQLAAVKHGDRLRVEAQKTSAAQAKEAEKAATANFVSLGSVQAAGIKFQNQMRAQEEKAAKDRDRLVRKSLSDEQVAQQARNRMVQDGNKKRVDAAYKAMGAEKEGFDLAAVAAGGLAAAFSTVVQIGSSVNRMWEDMRNSTYEAAQNINGVREGMLELAALKGHLGDTTSEFREQAVFRARTLQTEGQAKAFQGQMLNVGQANIGNLISQEEFNKAMVAAGQFQAAEGGDAATHGKLAGIIPALVGKKGITADEVAGAEQKFFNIMQRGGFDFSSGANQLIDKQGLVTSGQFKDPSRMVAALSALSVGSSPLEAGTHLGHLVEGTTGAFDRLRKGKMDGETVATSQYLKSLGAKLGMDPLEMGKLVAEDVNKARDAGGADFDPTNYLQHKGYMNVQAREAVLALAGQTRNGQLAGFEARAASPTGLLPEDMAVPGFTPAADQLAQFQNSTVAAHRRNDLGKMLAKFSVGAGPISYYDQWQEMAFSAMQSKEPGKWTGEAKDWKNDQTYGGKEAIQRTMLDMLTEEARKKGAAVAGNTYPAAAGLFNYDFGAAGSYSSKDLDLGSEQSRSAKFVDIASKLGVSLDKSLMERLIQLNEQQLEATKRMEAAMGARGTPPPIVGARPAPAPNR